jgi:hypothetical protein
MKLLPRIWISLAIGLMFGHNIVAHKHTPVYELNLCQQERSTNLLHIIRHVFSIDQGDDHLQHFQLGSNHDRGLEANGNYDLFMPDQTIEISLYKQVTSYLATSFICSFKKTPIRIRALRAPPVV